MQISFRLFIFPHTDYVLYSAGVKSFSHWPLVSLMKDHLERFLRIRS